MGLELRLIAALVLLDKGGIYGRRVAGMEHVLGAGAALRTREITANGRFEHGRDLCQGAAGRCERGFEIGRPR